MTKPTFFPQSYYSLKSHIRKEQPSKRTSFPLYHPLSLILTLTSLFTKSPDPTQSIPSTLNQPDLQIPDPPIQMVRPTGLSAAAPQPSSSNSTATPCSPEICAPPYCLQACAAAATNNYYFLPPPAPVSDGSSGKISPLMITLITLLIAAFLLLAYYTFFSTFCKRRRFRRSTSRLQARIDQLILQDQTTSSLQLSEAGLNDHFIKSITVFKFKRGDGLVESTECAVCLTEFNEGENLRLMPNCQHAFHPPCIDTWLRAHASCPICRSLMVGPPPATAPAPVVSRMTVERGGGVVVVVDAGGQGCVRVVGGDGDGDNGRRQVAPAAEGEEVGEKGRSND